MIKHGYSLTGFASLALAACGATYSPADAPGQPCPEITAAEYSAFSKTGSAKALAKVGEDGTVSIKNGSGQVQCAAGKSELGPCRRPNPLVIRYQYANGSTTHVRVPAETEYRFRQGAEPTSCEIIVGSGSPV